jgi:hypothetical protein
MLNAKYNKKTFAEISKIFANKYKGREHDPVSQKTLDMQMQKLMALNEEARIEKEIKDGTYQPENSMEMKYGGYHKSNMRLNYSTGGHLEKLMQSGLTIGGRQMVTNRLQNQDNRITDAIENLGPYGRNFTNGDYGTPPSLMETYGPAVAGLSFQDSVNILNNRPGGQYQSNNMPNADYNATSPTSGARPAPTKSGFTLMNYNNVAGGTPSGLPGQYANSPAGAPFSSFQQQSYPQPTGSASSYFQTSGAPILPNDPTNITNNNPQLNTRRQYRQDRRRDKIMARQDRQEAKAAAKQENQEERQGTFGNMTQGDMMQLASHIPSAAYNLFQGLKPAQQYSPIQNPRAGEALQQLDSLKIDMQPMINQSNLNFNAARRQLSNQVGGGSLASNLANLLSNTNTNMNNIRMSEQQANNQYASQAASAKLGVGEQDRSAAEQARQLNIASDATKQSFTSAGMSQIGEGLNQTGIGMNAGKLNEVITGLASSMNFYYNKDTGTVDFNSFIEDNPESWQKILDAAGGNMEVARQAVLKTYNQ